MSRPLRIEYPGAWYHVMNRGRRKESIFLQPDDYDAFLQILRETTSDWNLRIAAYCLMPNHYHLLVQTPDGNLSRCMRHINGVYTQRFNRFHQQDGQLFRGRYKAVLVETDNYLLEVMRYIHRNPLNAGLVRSLDEYPWSSHSAYLTSQKQRSWLFKDTLLTMLGAEKANRRNAYIDFVSLQNSREITDFYSKSRLSPLLGSESFRGRVRNRVSDLQENPEITEAKELTITPREIIAQVCSCFNLDEVTLKRTRRGRSNAPRDIAVYLVRRYSRKSLAETGSMFGIENYSTVSSIVQRIKSQKDRCSDLKRDIEKILSCLKTVKTDAEESVE